MKFRSGFISNSSSSSYVVVGWKKEDPNDCIRALAETYLSETLQDTVNTALEEGNLCYATHIIGRNAAMDRFDVIYIEEEHIYLIGAAIRVSECGLQEINDVEIEKVIGNMIQVLSWDMPPKVYAGTTYS